MKFEELSKEKNNLVEKEILNKWKENNILDKTIKNREGSKDFVFYDGPATANGFPVIRYTKLIFLNFLLNQGITGYSSLIQSI